MGENVTVCEVGPRDGLQMAKTQMSTATKIEWIRAIAAAGVREIEVGSFVPARVIPQMADTTELVTSCLNIPGLTVVALVPNLRGAQAAHAAGAHQSWHPSGIHQEPRQADRADTRFGVGTRLLFPC